MLTSPANTSVVINRIHVATRKGVAPYNVMSATTHKHAFISSSLSNFLYGWRWLGGVGGAGGVVKRPTQRLVTGPNFGRHSDYPGSSFSSVLQHPLSLIADPTKKAESGHCLARQRKTKQGYTYFKNIYSFESTPPSAE